MYNDIDLDLNNYNYNELLSIFNLTDYNEEHIINKLNTIILETKELVYDTENYKSLVDFFLKAFIKVKNYNNSNYTNISNKDSIEVFKLDYKKDILNPLKIQTIKKIIAINSLFRNNNFKEPSEFDINLSEPLKNIISVRLINYILPLSIYTISDKLGSNNFRIHYNSINVLIVIENGSYNVIDIINIINQKLKDNNINDIIIKYNEITGKISFYNTKELNFILDFTYNINLTNVCNNYLSNNKYLNKEFEKYSTLGWILGYRNIDNKNYYTNNYYYESESIYDINNVKEYNVLFDDYNNNTISTFNLTKNNSYQLLNDKNILAKINSNNTLIEYPKRKYLGPVNINKINIKIVDDFGRIIDTNSANISIDIECEIIY